MAPPNSTNSGAGAVPQDIDRLMDRVAAAIAKVQDAQGSIVSLPKAEFDLLKQIEDIRDFLGDALSKQNDRTGLRELFGGDRARIVQIRSMCERVSFSEMNQGDQRLKSCLSLCQSVERVVMDLGDGEALRKAQRKARVDAKPHIDIGAGALPPSDGTSEPDSTECTSCGFSSCCADDNEADTPMPALAAGTGELHTPPPHSCSSACLSSSGGACEDEGAGVGRRFEDDGQRVREANGNGDLEHQLQELRERVARTEAQMAGLLADLARAPPGASQSGVPRVPRPGARSTPTSQLELEEKSEHGIQGLKLKLAMVDADSSAEQLERLSVEADGAFIAHRKALLDECREVARAEASHLLAEFEQTLASRMETMLEECRDLAEVEARRQLDETSGDLAALREDLMDKCCDAAKAEVQQYLNTCKESATAQSTEQLPRQQDESLARCLEFVKSEAQAIQDKVTETTAAEARQLRGDIMDALSKEMAQFRKVDIESVWSSFAQVASLVEDLRCRVTDLSKARPVSAIRRT
mmetsp:Transcript_67547/g.170458  ORF Transcript_67547/g.170458 Transcript_67547/m.170458 type:complete len:526 (+) Transcript_67547:124-1701(+)|eukprot:CAMPEP_0115278784 /NCGR_PEP_ID=MMETSP0270-20121206/57930_1 /TAXON_ID=71861 /ORGANISM="Scrippsiella trochoidea, Strain CCMP3099" /LENGTH=525 /DNA_ID=CAMNT_0002695459 /DNA_START=55 /DNA_END=1632 /DNA_ORIENTATION=+